MLIFVNQLLFVKTISQSTNCKFIQAIYTSISLNFSENYNCNDYLITNHANN